MDRRGFLATSLAGVLAGPFAADAQQGARRSRIGFLRVGPPPSAWIEGFRQGLHERGLVEGQHYVIEFGLARDATQLPPLAAELVRLKVDVLVASGTPSVVPSRDATRTIPVVFVAAIDPVAAGITASLARPGGNVTGVTAMHGDLIAKRLSLLKELLPRVSRIAVLTRAKSPATAAYLKEAELGAQAVGVQLHLVSVQDPGDLDTALGGLGEGAALLVADDAVFTAHRVKIADLALKHHLPTAYGFSDMVEAGGLMAYGPHYGDMYRRAAIQVHKILRGARPAELPIEQPTRFELVLNLRTARALGLVIPPSLLARSDQIIQ
jgi:putative ABC transport system substrate-binding protein